jgi:hypothetical protein
MRKLIVAACIVAGALVPSAAHAQDEWVQQVRTMLRTAAEEGKVQLEPTAVHAGSLNEGASKMVAVALEGGQQYQVYGRCDVDCRDLDLVLYDGNGNQLAQDNSLDAKPVLTITPTRSGTYHVKVVMAACSSSPCRWGIGVFRI